MIMRDIFIMIMIIIIIFISSSFDIWHLTIQHDQTDTSIHIESANENKIKKFSALLNVVTLSSTTWSNQ